MWLILWSRGAKKAKTKTTTTTTTPPPTNATASISIAAISLTNYYQCCRVLVLVVPLVLVVRVLVVGWSQDAMAVRQRMLLLPSIKHLKFLSPRAAQNRSPSPTTTYPWTIGLLEEELQAKERHQQGE